MVPCQMTDLQYRVYDAYLKDVECIMEKTRNDCYLDAFKIVKTVDTNSDSYGNRVAYSVINNLRKICNHPFLFFQSILDPNSHLSVFSYEHNHLE